MNDQLQDFGSLVGLVLALVALFTSARAPVVSARRLNIEDNKPVPGLTPLRAYVEFVLVDVLLFVVTFLLFLAGAPLLRAAVDLDMFLRRAGALQSAFALSWLLVLGLAVWQALTAYRSFKVAGQIKPRIRSS